MSNFSVPHSVFQGSVGGVETAVECGEENAALSLSSLVALPGLLDVFRDGLLAEHIFVVSNRVDDNVVVSPGRGPDEHNVDSVIENDVFSLLRITFPACNFP